MKKQKMIVIGSDIRNISKVLKQHKANAVIVQGEVLDATSGKMYKVASLITLPGASMTPEKAMEIGNECISSGTAADAFTYMPLDNIEEWSWRLRDHYAAGAIGKLLKQVGSEKLLKKHMNPTDFSRMDEIRKAA